MLVTPLVTDRSPQVDVIKSAHALGIPAALCVASWDHLTTKGLIRVQPDLVSVWNEEQKKEALALPRHPRADRLVVTGAQPFDRWFERRPTHRAASSAGRSDLPADRPFVLFVGSTASISAPEAELPFVRRWIDALRARASAGRREHPGAAASIQRAPLERRRRRRSPQRGGVSALGQPGERGRSTGLFRLALSQRGGRRASTPRR